MKTTIYEIIGKVLMSPALITGETELSYVAKRDNGFETEFCYAKRDEGVTWFWTEKEARTEFNFRTSKEFRMQELKKELEKLETETSQV